MNNEIISDAEKLRIAAIDDVKARQESSEEYRLYRRIQEDPIAAKNFEVFNTQCTIDEILNKFVLFIKNYHDGANESYRLNNNSPFYELVEEQDFINYVISNIIPSIDTEVYDKTDNDKVKEKQEERLQIAKIMYECNLKELRNFLFLSHSIKPLPIPEQQRDGSVDALECFAAGINPEAFYTKVDNWFMERKDYTSFNMKEIIIDGKINGRKMATKSEVDLNKQKKY